MHTKLVDRKVIFKCRVGSHLYGTSRPESDEDFYGVFLPSTQDLLSLKRGPDEDTSESLKFSSGPRNAAGDVDCKYFSLQKFISLAAEGQPGQLEMLFAPEHMVVYSSSEWKELVLNRHLFLSKKGISPFIGFALSQAHKAVIKGENLNLIRSLIEWSDDLSDVERRAPLKSQFIQAIPTEVYCGKQILPYYINAHGYAQVTIAGRDFDVGISIKSFINSLKVLESRYGTRTKAAAANGYDYKSLGHAVRLLGEAEEYLKRGSITLPRPNAEYLKTVLRGTIDDSSIDWFDFLNREIDYLKREVEPLCTHPEKPDWDKLNELCTKFLKRHIDG